MKSLALLIKRFWRDERGANGVEYALLAGLIAVAFVAGAGLLGTNLNGFFNRIAGCISSPSSTSCSITAPAAPANNG